MSSKPLVVLIHGMGVHTAPKPAANERGSFGKECIDTFNKAFQMYSSLKSHKIEDKVNFIEIHYDHIFDKIRKEMAENGQKISDLLQGAGAIANVPGLVTKVVQFEASLNDDDFFYTHWLDVILYKLYFGEFVRVHVAEKLGEIISKNSTQKIHILAHSLGTAVIHDTLSKLYNEGYADNDDIPDLSPITHKLSSLWQIANVSRLANSVLPVADPYKSLVKPGSQGVTETMMNIHHKLDPFTLPKSFSRTDNGKWVPSNVFKSKYLDIETSVITQLNTHSITQYLHDPAVHLYLFRALGIKVPPKAQRDKAIADYKNLVIDKAEEKLKKKLNTLVKTNAATLKDYVDAAKRLMQFIESM
ncbi:alpha/beta hydrolase [Aliikangiella sp. G2MR2-5]|uniref:alpha/beta hydrolase n=1 Tax=Aliikangiella sp. G2MR2-5 TaxID=2788943 RepID=UPI0018A8A77C|nr:alpha/beta hydrolase [Aliikangiella sp. G2MR2-5]